MNSTQDVDRLREVFTAFDPVRGPNKLAAAAPSAAPRALPQAPDRTPVRWSRMALVAAAVVATIAVPVALLNAGPPATSALASGQAAGEDYETIMSDRAVIQRAEQELISRCMAAAGFEYTPIEPLPARWRQLTHPLTVQAAAQSGYASVMAPLTSPSAEANNTYMAALSKADQERYGTTLNGTPGDSVELGAMRIPKSGCVRQADRDLFGDAVKWAELSMFLSDLPGFSEDNDATLTSVTQEWASCMNGRGYQFNDPSAAMQKALSQATPDNRLDADGNDVPVETAGTNPQAARDIAVADATCRAKTGWDDANRSAAQQALAALFAANKTEMTAYHAMATAGLAKARTVLGE